ncbi:hypothetical protein [Kaistella jeonii]|uniref:Uncharacterized protein n=1 Tax=Kaistella jeonii TaxID=266749 RepID=A0A0C1D2E4_9FLAO|nr:hypothetical protein [Kaistella jeonii]KIA87955.1 hypothetical protein OA86_12965 [Kaistella jeonii]SFC07552.1 hypothetical protein SAMN05421876_1061 [Kaistella jeonii]VEI95129.1 Uncharacterised protein [Kaistella jeonii]
MPLINLRSVHLTPAELATIKQAMTDLETTLQNVNVPLTPEDRLRYGSINEQNKLLVNKVKDFHTNSPELSVTDVDWDEFDRDYNSRGNYESLIARLESLVLNMRNAKILHDYDNYQTALADYAYTSYRAGGGTLGYETKQNELKQFFNRSGKTAPAIPE